MREFLIHQPARGAHPAWHADLPVGAGQRQHPGERGQYALHRQPAISGQWANAEAATTGANTTPKAAQDQAITDLLATLSDLGTGTGATGSLVPAVVSLDNNAKKLTSGASGWRSAGPAVSSDITTLNKTCAADVTGQSHVG